jgi:uncharacterized protein (PEP-CTERM system associated)
MNRRTSAALLCLGIIGASVSMPAAAGRSTQITPFIDVGEFTEQQLHGVGDSVTYSQISVGLAGTTRTRRIVASVNYQLEQRLTETGRTQNNRSQNGLARVRIELVDNLLALDAGAIATHTRTDPGGAAPQADTGSAKNLSQIYSFFISPSLIWHVGELGIAANYRYGYVINQGSVVSGTAGQTPVEQLDNSQNHNALLSIGMKRSSLPFDWSIDNQYQFDTTSNLARHTITASSIAGVTVPATHSIALVTSGGYESTTSSERGALLVNGVPVRTSKGKFVVDPNSPRVLTYDVQGLIANGGLLWVPSRRTRLEARAGYRHGGLSLTGQFDYVPSARNTIHITVFDQIDTAGIGVTDGLASTPAAFDPTQNISNSPIQNCVTGTSGASGGCLGNTLGSASASSYHSRGATLTLGHQMRQTAISLSAGYQRRTYIGRAGVIGSLNGVVDQSWTVQAGVTHQLSRISGVNFALSGNLFNNGAPGVADVKAVALNGGYFRTFGRKLRAQATFGIEDSKTDGAAADIIARAQLTLGYQF